MDINFQDQKSFVLSVELKDNQGLQAEYLEKTKYETLMVSNIKTMHSPQKARIESRSLCFY